MRQYIYFLSLSLMSWIRRRLLFHCCQHNHHLQQQSVWQLVSTSSPPFRRRIFFFFWQPPSTAHRRPFFPPSSPASQRKVCLCEEETKKKRTGDFPPLSAGNGWRFPHSEWASAAVKISRRLFVSSFPSFHPSRNISQLALSSLSLLF